MKDWKVAHSKDEKKKTVKTNPGFSNAIPISNVLSISFKLLTLLSKFHISALQLELEVCQLNMQEAQNAL